MSQVEKIVVHYKNEKPRVITQGMALYFENNLNDLLMEAVKIDDSDIEPILHALSLALKLAKQNVPGGNSNDEQ